MKTTLKLIGGKKIISPKEDITRPTTLMVREALFNILRGNVLNSNWLDLFSGTGAISCEAINHGAKKIIAIEKSRINSEICFKNIFSVAQATSMRDGITVLREDAFSWLKSKNNTKESNVTSNEGFEFDFVYIDPPYKSNYYEAILDLLRDNKFIGQTTTIICEHSKYSDFKIGNYLKLNDERVYGQTKLKFLVKV